MKRFFLFPVLILMSALPLTTHAADATSFDPTLVKVTAKPISSIPVGTIISWPVAQNPADWQNPDGSFNWLECNGQTISQAAYPELFALLGGRVPDLRGLFLRGYGSQSHAQNNGSTVGVTSTTHASGALGQVQGDAIRNARGWMSMFSNMDKQPEGVFSSDFTHLPVGAVNLDVYTNWDNLVFDISRVVPTSTEIRPVNVAVRYFVRARP